MLASTFLVAAAAFINVGFAQLGFTNPNGTAADFSQTFTIGNTVLVSWVAGWKGYGQDPGYADLFVTSFESDAYSANVIANKSTAEGGTFNWRVNIPADFVASEHGKFAFKWVRSLNPPNYLAANAAKVLSPSRGFNVKLASSAGASSATGTFTVAKATGTSTSASATSSTPASSSSSDSNTGGTQEDKGSSTPVGAIVGGVVGGVAALAVIAFLLFYIRRMKKKSAVAGAGVEPEYVHNGYQDQNGYQDHYAPVPATEYKGYANEFEARQAPQELDGGHTMVEADNNQNLGTHVAK